MPHVLVVRPNKFDFGTAEGAGVVGSERREWGLICCFRTVSTTTEQSSGHDTITFSEARSRLDQRRFSRPRPHFLAFFKIYKKITFSRANPGNFCQKIGKICKNFNIFWQILQNFAKFSEIRKNFAKFCRIFCRILQKCVDFEKC